MWENGMGRFYILAITLLALMNVAIVIAHLARLRNDDALLPLITLLIMVLVIWTAFMRVRGVLRDVSAQLDRPHLEGLRLNASMIAIAANAAITCSLPFLR